MSSHQMPPKKIQRIQKSKLTLVLERLNTLDPDDINSVAKHLLGTRPDILYKIAKKVCSTATSEQRHVLYALLETSRRNSQPPQLIHHHTLPQPIPQKRKADDPNVSKRVEKKVKATEPNDEEDDIQATWARVLQNGKVATITE